MSEERKPFWARCGVCSHCWIAAYTPMLLGAIAKLLKGLHCPACGTDSRQIFATRITPSADRAASQTPQADPE